MNKTAISAELAAGLAASALGAGVGAYTTDTSLDKTPEEKLRHRVQNASIGLATGGLAGYGLTAGARALGLFGQPTPPPTLKQRVSNAFAGGVMTKEQISKAIEGKTFEEATKIIAENNNRQSRAKGIENELSLDPTKSRVASSVYGGGLMNAATGFYQNKLMPKLETVYERLGKIVSLNDSLPRSTPGSPAVHAPTPYTLRTLERAGDPTHIADKSHLGAFLGENPSISGPQFNKIMGRPHANPQELIDLRDALHREYNALPASIPEVLARNTPSIGGFKTVGGTIQSAEEAALKARDLMANMDAGRMGEMAAARSMGMSNNLTHKFMSRTLPRGGLTALAAILSFDLPNVFHPDKNP